MRSHALPWTDFPKDAGSRESRRYPGRPDQTASAACAPGKRPRESRPREGTPINSSSLDPNPGLDAIYCGNPGRAPQHIGTARVLVIPAQQALAARPPQPRWPGGASRIGGPTASPRPIIARRPAIAGRGRSQDGALFRHRPVT
jgi:hypothetical protein